MVRVSAGQALPGTGACCGRCCPWACMYLQSEADMLQLDGARVSEPWLLTALGAWPAPAPSPSRRQAACRWRPPQPRARSEGPSVSQTWEEAVCPVWPLPALSGT